ncbi:MAG TPA: sugar transferase [Acidimicrobiia bacterium]|nr:sugar transferase [Acidimicrobiia bacterium]
MSVATTTLQPLRESPDATRAETVALLPTRAKHGKWEAPTLLLCFDVVALGAALFVSGASSSLLGIAYVLGALAVLAASQAYRVRISLSVLDSAPWLLGRLAIPFVLLAPIVLVAGIDAAVFAEILLAMAFVVAARGFSYGAIRALRRRGLLLDRTVILGAGQIGAELATMFRQYPQYGVDPVGFLDSVSGPLPLPLPLLGDVDALDRMLKRHDLRRVIVAFGPAREAELVGVLRTAVRHEVEVHIVPRFFDCGVAPQGPDTDDVRGIPLYRVRRAALRDRAWVLKRIVDVVVAGAALIATAPLFLLGALLVRRGSPGPIFFRQRRVGQNGREFEMLKFRTLPVDYVDNKCNASDDDYQSGAARFLRRSSLDELPQLLNVLRGDMSLVGPRPERRYLVEQFNEDVNGYSDRWRLPVGMTGWAQVNGLRGETSLEERARFDNQYIEHWSLWRDLVVLVRTLTEVVRGARGAER